MAYVKFIALFISVHLLFSCSNYEQDESALSKNDTHQIQGEVLRSVNDFTSFNLPFPEGTTFNFDESVLKFELPEPYYLLGIDASGQFHRSHGGGSGNVRCKCSQGSGCNPIKMGGDYGCLMVDGCSACTKSTSRIDGVDVDIVNLAILNPNVGLQIDDFSQLNGKRLLPIEFAESSEVFNLLNQWQSTFSNQYNEAKKEILINVYGYVLPVEVPVDQHDTSIAFLSNNGGGVGSACSCNVAGACPKKRKFSVVWCDATGCTDCSLSGLVQNSDGVVKTFTETNGLISIY